MAKKTLKAEDLRDYIEAKLIDKLVEIDDTIADEFEIECWDSCLDGAVWNNALTTLAKMYADAVISDRDYTGYNKKQYKVKVDLSSVVKRVKLEREIKRMKKELADLE